MSLSLSIGKTYSFSTVSPVFLGSKIVNAKLKSIADAETARKFAPIDQVWAQVYPTLPTGTINDVNAAVFYIFEALNKTTVVMAAPWIVEDSLTLIEATTITVTLSNASLSDVEKVRLALTATGFSNFAIQTS